MKLLNLNLLLTISIFIIGNVVAQKLTENPDENINKYNYNSLFRKVENMSVLYHNLSKNCKIHYLQNYEDCVDYIINDNNIDYTCVIANSKSCKYLRDNIFEQDTLEICNENEYDKILHSYINSRKGTFAGLCTKDENNNICPLYEAVKYNNIIYSDSKRPSIKEKALETCKSRKCVKVSKLYFERIPDTITFIKYIFDLKEVSDKDDQIYEFVEPLKTCPYYSEVQEPDSNSSQTQTHNINIYSLFVFSVSMILIIYLL